MTDEDLGTKILTLVCQTTAPNIRQKVGAAARALLTKPVATRDAVNSWLTIRYPVFKDERGTTTQSLKSMSTNIFAALQHFAAPDRPKMMIEGMTAAQIEAEMYIHHEEKRKRMEGVIYIQECARVAHRLANTPAPVVDEDAKAKEFLTKIRRAGFVWTTTNELPDLDRQTWETGTEEMRQYCRRVVAKEVGGE